MIVSFRDKETERIFNDQFSRRLPQDVQRAARRKLVQLNDAFGLEELRSPPGNRFEVLSGDRAGQYSIRVNQQWRICFFWEPGRAREVELCDYH